MRRRAINPARMHNWAAASRGISTVEVTSEAASRTVPAAVTHEFSGCGERNQISGASEVWLSSSSVNHTSHSSQVSCRFSAPRMRKMREIISTAEGGDPARTTSISTCASRREKLAYMVGRYEISKATMPRPSVASLNCTSVTGRLVNGVVPSVRKDDPLTVSACSQGRIPIDQ